VNPVSRLRAFTLIELLVVSAIIGILAALVLPALSRAKQSSRQAACLSNLRQIGLAFSLYLDEHADRFADRRDLKTALGYKPWSDWPKSDPRGGWAAIVLSNQLGNDHVWLCSAVNVSSLRSAPQTLQASRPTDTNSVVSYWLWRFDRFDDPVPLDNFWTKTPEQALRDLREANNPTVGQPNSPSDVELAVDPYFPSTVPSLPPALAGRAIHARGRNSLMLDGHAEFVRDPRIR
jgi:prepilin-type N-terminal cleavage/methylation domain-containing protein/prepilin-type processing-associated H-X9-DG protein